MASVSAKLNEPSMDDILSSIRRIISGDLAAVEKQEPAFAEVPDEAGADVLDLAGQAVISSSRYDDLSAPIGVFHRPVQAATPSSATADLITQLSSRMGVASSIPNPDQLDRVVDELRVNPPPVLAAVKPEPETVLVSPQSAEAVSSAFGALREPTMSAPVAVGVRESAADAAFRLVVESSLRPMLQQWLDANLPAMVEKLVRAEIERLSRGR